MGNNSRKTSMQPTSIIIKIFACLLVATCFQQPAAQDTTLEPMEDLCWCINPWKGTAREWMGNPDKTCPEWCYVSCDSDCRDKKNAKGKDRCWSKIACDMKTPLKTELQLEIKY